MNNFVFWCGVQGNNDVKEKYRYGDFLWMEYSKKTWEYWCKKNSVTFIHYDKTSMDNQLKYKINWQRWFDIEHYISDFDQILLVDASIMVKWDAPNFFNESDNKWCGLIGNENLKWLYESINGYKPLFKDYNFDYSHHLLAGFTLFNKSHLPFLNKFKQFYFENHETILNLEDRVIKRGRDQPILNYFLQMNNIDVKTFPINYGANHMYRRNILGGNPPLFTKYFNTWIFSGFPDRGDSRTQLMEKTWEFVKSHYE